MALYQVKVEDIVKRKHVIAQKTKAPLRQERFYHYTTEGIDLPVISVPIELPVYRMENYRTRTRQRRYIHSNRKAATFFSKGSENVSAQRAQHEILVELANKGRGDSIISIVSKLVQDQRQTDSLLLTHEGVVLNGNRRLAAMRELLTENADTYRTFEYIQALILPEHITASELPKIEVQLQMQQEAKLPYDWTDECIAVRDLQNSGMSKQQIMRLMRLDKESDVQAMLDQLAEAEMYLAEYVGNPDAYEAIEFRRRQFIELQEALSRMTDPGEKEVARKLCNVMITHSHDLRFHVDDFRLALSTKCIEAAERLLHRLDLTPPATDEIEMKRVKDDFDAIFGDDLEPSGVAARLMPLRVALMDKSQSRFLADAIMSVLDELRWEEECVLTGS